MEETWEPTAESSPENNHSLRDRLTERFQNLIHIPDYPDKVWLVIGGYTAGCASAVMIAPERLRFMIDMHTLVLSNDITRYFNFAGLLPTETMTHLMQTDPKMLVVINGLAGTAVSLLAIPVLRRAEPFLRRITSNITNLLSERIVEPIQQIIDSHLTRFGR